jgi:hypothetical protein
MVSENIFKAEKEKEVLSLSDLEHPDISRVNQTGYTNMSSQPEHAGIDYFGDEILAGDDIVIDGDEIILQSNLEEYLEENYHFQFKTAE